MLRSSLAVLLVLAPLVAQDSKPTPRPRAVPLSGGSSAALPATRLVRFAPANAPELAALDAAIAADAELAKAFAKAFTVETVALDTEDGAARHQRLKSPCRGAVPGLVLVDRAGEPISIVDPSTWKTDGKWDAARIQAFIGFWSKPAPASDRLAKVKQKYGQIYDPKADAMAELDAALAKAKTSGKHVIVKIGGNWCPWCYLLHDELESRPELGKLVADNYVFLRVNWDPQNHNEKVMERLENPSRFGFPVLVVLDADGKRLHTQDSGLLESGDHHDPRKVASFLQKWTPAALRPTTQR